jgi:hypothetical protein
MHLKDYKEKNTTYVFTIVTKKDLSSYIIKNQRIILRNISKTCMFLTFRIQGDH